MPSLESGRYCDGVLPANVILGRDSVVSGDRAFKRFLSRRQPALVIGSHCTMDGVQFALAEDAEISIGESCYFANAILMCEKQIIIGHHVVMGFNTVVADSDFHPLAPALRIADAIALSPLGHGRPRQPPVALPVVIEADVWIGPLATILKGVRIGEGSFVEPGALVTRNVPPYSRVAGNPAHIVGEA